MNARQRKKASLGCYRHRRYTSPPKPVGNAGMPTTPAAFLDAIGMRGQWGESCASSPSWDGLPMFYARDSASGLDVCEPIIDGDRVPSV